MRLYKGRYLIALLDKEGNIEEVGGIDEIKLSNYRLREYCSRKAKGKCPLNKFELIDIFEKHDDIFAEEDEEFIKFYEAYGYKSDKERMRELGMSERKYYRLKKYKNLGKTQQNS